jgi:hypothetical protein
MKNNNIILKESVCIMSKCVNCGKEMNQAKGADKLAKGVAWGGLILGGPVSMAAGAGYLAFKGLKKHLGDEVPVICCNCGCKNYVSKQEAERLIHNYKNNK